MKGRILAFTTFIVPFLLQAQITGKVNDKLTNNPIIGAKILASDGSKTISDFDGNFNLNVQKFPVTIIVSMLQYVNDTIVVNKAGEIVIKLGEPEKDFETVVVSAGRRRQAIEEVPVSMEIIRPQLIDN